MRTMTNRTATALGVLALASSGVTGVAVSESAQAANDRNGKCEKGEFCYNYNSNLKGSWSDFKKSEDNYGTDKATCFEFRGKGKGKSKCIKNDAGGYWNRTGKTVRVYFNSEFGGKSAKLKSGSKGKLPASVYNDNASHRIGGGGGNPSPGGEHVLPFPCKETWVASIWSGHSPSDNSVDFNHYPSDDGWKVYASKAGKVESAGTGAGGYGNTVVIDHGNGEKTRYAHLKSMKVSAGKKVTAKTNIGRVGQSGGQDSTHLHYEQIKGGTVVKPKFKDGSPKWMAKTNLQRKSACP